ncbi:MAG: hypothetical protein C4323_13335, partial [Mastigocladus sp. ERB_26_2]
MGNSPAPTPCQSRGLGAVGRWGEKTTTNQQPYPDLKRLPYGKPMSASTCLRVLYLEAYERVYASPPTLT